MFRPSLFSIVLLLRILRFLKIKDNPVDAIPEPGRRRTVIEDMPQV
jgi:hypothetical protein